MTAMSARSFLVCVVSLAIAGCAGFGPQIVPGSSTLQDVQAKMATPTIVKELADGDRILYYSQQPYGRQTYAVRLSPDGVVRSMERTLTPEKIEKLKPGTTTKQSAEELLGPVYRVTPETRNRALGDTWEYWTSWGPVPQRLWLSFSDDGVLRKVTQLDDEPCDPLRFCVPGPGFGAFFVRRY